MDCAVTADRQHVLIVDDEPQVLVALEDLLSDDYVVLKTGSGEQAIELARQDPDIAVVISDQRMPEITGDQLLQEVRRQSHASRVLLTGYADLSAIVRAVNEGHIFAYVNKPWDSDSFKLTVNRAAERFLLRRELAKERQLLVDLMNNVSDGVFFKDTDLRFLKVNPVYAQFLNRELPLNEMVGRTLADLFRDTDLALVIEAEERRILQGGEPIVEAIREHEVSGRKRWYSTSSAPVLSVDGSVEGLVGITRDVTDRIKTTEELRINEERFRLVFEASCAGLFDWDITADRVAYSGALAKLLNTTVDALSPDVDELRSRLHPDDAEVVGGHLTRHLEEREPLCDLECRLRNADAEYRWFTLSAQAIWNQGGQATRLVGSLQDITARKEQEGRIQRLMRVHSILGGINGAIVRSRERTSLFNNCCSIAVRQGGFALSMIVVQNELEDHVVACAGDDTPLIEIVRKALQSGIRLGSFEASPGLFGGKPLVFNDLGGNDLCDGERSSSDSVSGAPFGELLRERGYRSVAYLPLMINGELDSVFVLAAKQEGAFDDEELKLLASMSDNVAFALEHAAKSQRLNFLTNYDGLTGLARRDLFLDRVSQRITAGKGLALSAVLWLDINRFGRVNDSFGRAVGDELLRQTAARLEACVGESDSLARLDSNAFGIISPGLEAESDVIDVLTPIVESVSRPYNINDIELRVAVVVGIAIFPNDGNGPEILVSHAETAAKTAKASGQTHLFYAAEMNQRVADKVSMETRLRRAIENKEFVLHYQPKVNLDDGTVVGLEALIRWNDPKSGLVPPGAFIPILEETSMILQIGPWVVEEAARQYAEWKDAGLEPPPIAVNVSALQLADPGFIPSLERPLALYPQAQGRLELEVTESAVMKDLVSHIETLKTVRQLGLRVAVDDFGTGYSSLGYLSRLPIDSLKIDHSFVTKMSGEAQDLSIVTTIISLARSMDLKVIAEGVETTDQAHLLRLLRCHQVQGFLVSRPVPPNQAVALFEAKYSFTPGRSSE